jgi:hypothetical protein
MKLPEDIRLKIEKSADKEDILLLLARLESDGETVVARSEFTACPRHRLARAPPTVLLAGDPGFPPRAGRHSR